MHHFEISNTHMAYVLEDKFVQEEEKNENCPHLQGQKKNGSQ